LIVPTRDGRHVEIQVRTAIQSQWANISEQAAGRFGMELKYGGGDRSLLERLTILSETGRQLEVAMGRLEVVMGDFVAGHPEIVDPEEAIRAALTSDPDLFRLIGQLSRELSTQNAAWRDTLG
jgi:ppGpp synthetase/RelA/SpoT-type nucleotidyltranferase